MEGKWFADSLAGVLLHSSAHYPNGDCHIVSVDVPDERLSRLYRSANLDRFGPATYLESNDLEGLRPIFEVADD